LRQADLALYRAKENGRDRAEYFEGQVRAKAISQLTTERMLRRAIDERRLVVEYQPIIALVDRSVVGVEALVRVDNEACGLVYPPDFLGVAERTGLLVEIDELVMADAIHRASAWSRVNGGTVDIAVNLTARHLSNFGFHCSLLAALAAADIDPHRLQVEVTEQVLMEASSSAIAGLLALREAGVQVGLDHFGAGYSSLAYLQRFPLDFLKIDKSIVDELPFSPASRAIVAGIIAVACVLTLSVVAEGVETSQQLRVLEALGCERIQGFLFSRSLAPSGIDAYLETHAPQAR
jgi:EAL domain-containing protein (putative c-di-GMP-specific phosphodiesterase class I)